ncbi:MAG TPA: phosphate ABC transporter substrate-binding protein [Patescibacteria group bacterium]|nr:phosphate ABC transporter substrate-binding protein [Patescibacteria group bacterium]
MKHHNHSRGLRLAAFCCSLLLLLPLLGCGKQARQESLLIAGSSTLLPYMEKLKEAFQKNHPQILIEDDAGGSTAGLIAVKRGAIDLAMMSREVTREEDDQYTRDYLIGKDAVVIVSNPANPLANLSRRQLQGIFGGQVTNWSQAGGNNASITVVGRKVGSTTRKGMEEMVMEGIDFAKSATLLESADAVFKTVAADPNAIGYLALKDVHDGVRALRVDDVSVSRETILSGRYPLSRDFFLVIYDKPKNAIQNFVDFALSNDGQKILEHEGLIRVY